MVAVEGGTFTMGGEDRTAGDDECPHSVTVDDFSIGRYEVTQGDWTGIMGTSPSYFEDCPPCPVEQVSWEDVQEFLQRLNTVTGEQYRLPTEAEWEFAANGGSRSRSFLYAGGDDPAEVAWYEGNSGRRTHPVGTLRPNELGLFDMSGNVAEWSRDLKHPYPCDLGGKAFDARVLRGGSWSNRKSSVRVKDRNGRASYHRLSTIGFRLAR